MPKNREMKKLITLLVLIFFNTLAFANGEAVLKPRLVVLTDSQNMQMDDTSKAATFE